MYREKLAMMKNTYRTIYGAIAGDIIGSMYEFRSVKSKDFKLFPYGACFTDDTVMTLAIARWLMEDVTRSEYTLVDTMCEFGNRYPAVGYGGLFCNWLCNDPTPYNSWGNGSAMRVSAVGLVAKTLDECLRLAKQTAAVSHNHPEAIKGAQAVAASIFIALHWTWGNRRIKSTHKRFCYQSVRI
ncbi:ADP-ribosylglycohydrolase family protein [Parabacteroides distasonis]|nr:ADP-ribosylglycohydrolase family protein [Parabacteroides distasonis]